MGTGTPNFVADPNYTKRMRLFCLQLRSFFTFYLSFLTGGTAKKTKSNFWTGDRKQKGPNRFSTVSKKTKPQFNRK